MSRITIISPTQNQFSGTLPDIGLGVQELYVGANKLSGAIPKFISNSSKLWGLDIGYNSFSGFIPSTLCALTNLEILKLHTNNLTIDTSTPEANFVSCLAINLTNLQTFTLTDNPLNATLPVSFGNLSTSLSNLGIRNCSMMVNIPDDIDNLSSLIFLDLGNNQLSLL
ncbi:hypothetical protein L3X38_022063 [Prunus dulcis]|uniref:Uncharacterized protein n=1 Tax=Prunus dulcis TaxID=3755 RepID=A0AAD4Z3L6_PRUDU|nr:putative receptor-like protein kinase At3g47110 [Prunus dulcis]KAI5331491.1 hypothetical protein L3X38_021617 [Prunus dulcis]KAI5331936.1 hypothetical protein L3X38_022063 [Prunus dulcis]